MIRTMIFISLLALAAACASVPQEPVIEDTAFVEAAFLEDVPEQPVEIVETPPVLPFPGQMKPVDGTNRTMTRVYATPGLSNCDSLAGMAVEDSEIGLPTRGAVITGAEMVASGGENGMAHGAYCHVSGAIRSIDPAAPPILFEIAMPVDWNEKVVMLGGGGFNGVIPKVDGNLQNTSDEILTPLARGYAVFGSDSGHQANAEQGAIRYASDDFFANDEAFRNYIGDALKKTRDVSVRVIERAYGRPAERSYFVGGSKGGHEALQVARRWPDDWDGVVAFYPSPNFTMSMVGATIISQAMAKPGAFLPIEKRKLLRHAALSACDMLDGLEDGIISNVEKCNLVFDLRTARFDGRPLRCPGGEDLGIHCLSDAQIQAIDAIGRPTHLGFRLANGQTVFPGYNILTSGIGGSSDHPLEKAVALQTLGLTAPTSPISEGNSAATIGADSYFRKGVVKDPAFNLLTIDLAHPDQRWVNRLEKLSQYDATDLDLADFADRGGKMIIMHGTDDFRISPRETRAWYDWLELRMGHARLDKSVRYYEIPGFGHGSGTIFRLAWDQLSAIESWVEQSVDPGNAQVLTDMVGIAGRSRPACRFPAWPRYRGFGDPNTASSFVCSTQ